jgi:hypothetical protein
VSRPAAAHHKYPDNEGEYQISVHLAYPRKPVDGWISISARWNVGPNSLHEHSLHIHTENQLMLPTDIYPACITLHGMDRIII